MVSSFHFLTKNTVPCHKSKYHDLLLRCFLCTSNSTGSLEILRLTFGKRYNQSLANVEWPSKLHTLTLGSAFNRDLEAPGRFLIEDLGEKKLGKKLLLGLDWRSIFPFRNGVVEGCPCLSPRPLRWDHRELSSMCTASEAKCSRPSSRRFLRFLLVGHLF